jgi:hypothetical protein
MREDGRENRRRKNLTQRRKGKDREDEIAAKARKERKKEGTTTKDLHEVSGNWVARLIILHLGI